MRDFDAARREREAADRSFQIGGKQFVYRPAVAPEAIMVWSEFAGGTDKEQAQLRAADANLAAANAQLEAVNSDDHPNPTAVAEASLEVARRTAAVAEATAAVEAKTRSDREWLQVIDETIAAILEPDYHETWEEVRNPELPHPLSLGDLQELMEWLIEQVVNRPTGKPSSSSPSGNGSATDLKGVSSLPEAPASVPSTSGASST